MDMQDKDKELELKREEEIKEKTRKLDKITNTCLLIVLFNALILSSINFIPEIITIIISLMGSSVFYACWWFRYKFKFDKFHVGLILMAITCIVLNIVNLNVHSEILAFVSTLCVYGYYMYGQKLIYGKISKPFILIFIAVISTSVLSMLFESRVIGVISFIIYIVLLMRAFNPTFRMIGERKRAKVDASGFTDEDAKKVPWIRKILFGRTGKLDLSILEAFKK